MGTQFAPIYATFVLGYVVDERLYPEISEIYNTQFIFNIYINDEIMKGIIEKANNVITRQS
jgi:hypothetical protein